MPAFSIQGMILVLSYLVLHPIAATGDNGSFHLVENNARRNAMCTHKSSKCQAFRFTYFPARYPQQPPPSPPYFLALFHANSNFFSGTISPNISNLPYLYEVDISNNAFSGTFPAAVVGLNGLIFLDVRFNMFSGLVPPAIFTQNLDVLFLNDNGFMSSLPASLGKTHIESLTLADNKFTGQIPSDISKLRPLGVFIRMSGKCRGS